MTSLSGSADCIDAKDGYDRYGLNSEDSLTFPQPELSEADAIQVGLSIFGIQSDGAQNLGSECDQAFMLSLGDTPLAVLKVSSTKQDAGLLDLEEAAALHAAACNAELPVAIPMIPILQRDVSGTGSESLGDNVPRRAYKWEHAEKNGTKHWVRCYPVMPGRVVDFLDGVLSDSLLQNWGGSLAKLAKALRAFKHPRAASRVTPWDVQHALRMRPLLSHVSEEHGLRAICEDVLRIFEDRVQPALSGLRHQVVHGDLNLGNALVQGQGQGQGQGDRTTPMSCEEERVSGIIDFGDMSYTALVVDIASALCGIGISVCAATATATAAETATATVGAGADADDTAGSLLRMGRILLDGYQSVAPLEEAELSILADIWMVRVCCEVILTSWRVGSGLEDGTRSAPEAPHFRAQLKALYGLGAHGRASGLTSATDMYGAGAVSKSLVERREGAIGPGSEPLSYGDSPLRVSSASGCWVFDASAGKKYLDCYNNVPCVGHAHPRVALAIGRQAQKAVTNMRYLHPFAVTLAERIKETLPPHLDTVFFVNSGSEANDLAWRMATSVTGARGALCTKHAYHGISEATIALSPETSSSCGFAPQHVERWAPPDAYRGTGNDDGEFRAALSRLQAKGLKPAMAILDGVMQSDGVLQLEPSYVQTLVRLTQEAGGLWCADEVQGGHGRTGSHMWSFQAFGILPDFVTMGKPMGNGHPVAACVTSRAIAERFVANEGVYFSTFGGNPVSCAAAHGVLDILQDECVLARCYAAGEELRKQAREATMKFECVGDVRGRGLACGIEIVVDRNSKTPDADKTSAVKNCLRRHGVLVGTAGIHSNVLKIRPPLAFTVAEVPIFVRALCAALEECGREGEGAVPKPLSSSLGGKYQPWK